MGVCYGDEEEDILLLLGEVSLRDVCSGGDKVSMSDQIFFRCLVPPIEYFI